MATWEDGPAYAPRQRPGDFAAPPLPPLVDPADNQPSPVDSEPTDRPDGRPGYRTPQAQPLHELTTVIAHGRDPHEPYRPAALALTPFDDTLPDGRVNPTEAHPAETANSTTSPTAFDPWAPMATTRHLGAPVEAEPLPAAASASYPNGPAVARPANQSSFPEPGTQQWFVPGPEPAAPPAQPTPGDIFRALTPAVLISLVIAGIGMSLALPIFVVAMFASTRIRYRKRWVRNTFLLALGCVLTVSLIVLAVTNSSFGTWWLIVSSLAMVSSWIVLFVLGIVVTRALQLRESPDQP